MLVLTLILCCHIISASIKNSSFEEIVGKNSESDLSVKLLLKKYTVNHDRKIPGSKLFKSSTKTISNENDIIADKTDGNYEPQNFTTYKSFLNLLFIFEKFKNRFYSYNNKCFKH
jgi:hypothetical protein